MSNNAVIVTTIIAIISSTASIGFLLYNDYIKAKEKEIMSNRTIYIYYIERK